LTEDRELNVGERIGVVCVFGVIGGVVALIAFEIFPSLAHGGLGGAFWGVGIGAVAGLVVVLLYSRKRAPALVTGSVVALVAIAIAWAEVTGRADHAQNSASKESVSATKPSTLSSGEGKRAPRAPSPASSVGTRSSTPVSSVNDSLKPHSVPAGLPTASPAAPSAPVVLLARRDTLDVQPDSTICEKSTHVGDPVRMHLLSAHPTQNRSTLSKGTLVIGRIAEKRSTGSQPPLFSIEADGLMVEGDSVSVTTNPVSFYMERPSEVGRVVKGSLIGAVAGAAVGFVLKKNVLAAVAVGTAVGGGIAAATANTEACVSPTDSRFRFVLTSEALHR
jgi:hypothetical protein